MAKPSPGRHRKAASKVWPSRAGDIINKGMGVVDVLGAKKALETAKLMKGDEDAVIEAADKWSEAAARLTAAEQPMSDSWNSLTADWEGGAYDAFMESFRRTPRIPSAGYIDERPKGVHRCIVGYCADRMLGQQSGPLRCTDSFCGAVRLTPNARPCSGRRAGSV
jgi:hypothetical protein